MPSAVTLSTVNALTKEIYGNRIVQQLQNEIVGLRRIERTSTDVTSEVGGKYVTFPIKVQRNAGIGYREEDELLQDAGRQGYARVNIGLKFGYGRVNLTGQVMDLADSNPQSFASAMDREMEGLKEDIRKDSARIFYGDGTGAWARATGAKTGQTIPVDNIVSFFGQIGAVLDVIAPNGPIVGREHPAYVDPNAQPPAQALLNAPLNTYPSGANLIASKVVLTGVDVAAKTITVAGTLGTVAAGNFIVRTGNYLREPFGLSALIGNQKIFYCDPAVYPVWQSVLNSNGGVNRPLSEGLMIKMTDDVRVNGGTTTLILTSLGVRRSYFNLLTQQRRYSNTKDFAGGMIGLAFNNGREIPVVDDPDALENKMWFLQESDFKVYRDKDWSWIDQDGGIWKWVTGKDSYEAVNKQYWQIGLERRNSQALLSDITES